MIKPPGTSPTTLIALTMPVGAKPSGPPVPSSCEMPVQPARNATNSPANTQDTPPSGFVMKRSRGMRTTIGQRTGCGSVVAHQGQLVRLVTATDDMQTLLQKEGVSNISQEVDLWLQKHPCAVDDLIRVRKDIRGALASIYDLRQSFTAGGDFRDTLVHITPRAWRWGVHFKDRQDFVRQLDAVLPPLKNKDEVREWLFESFLLSASNNPDTKRFPGLYLEDLNPLIVSLYNESRQALWSLQQHTFDQDYRRRQDALLFDELESSSPALAESAPDDLLEEEEDWMFDYTLIEFESDEAASVCTLFDLMKQDPEKLEQFFDRAKKGDLFQQRLEEGHGNELNEPYYAYYLLKIFREHLLFARGVP